MFRLNRYPNVAVGVVAGNEFAADPAPDVVDDRLGVANFRIAGVAGRFETRIHEFVDRARAAARRTAGAIETDNAKASMMPESVDPSLAILMKISPGVPSSYIPTVR